MAKRRTRKQKEGAKHKFAVQWVSDGRVGVSEAKNRHFEANVKGQFSSSSEAGHKPSRNYNNTKISDISTNLKQVKRDIAKSLVIAGFIIGIELVLYLALNK